MCAEREPLCVACGLRPCRILRFAWIHCERSAAIHKTTPRRVAPPLWPEGNLTVMEMKKCAGGALSILYSLCSIICALKMRRWRIFYSIQIAAYVVAFCPPTGICTLPLVTVTLPSVWDTSVTTAPVPDESESSPLIASVTAFCVIAPSVF